MVEELLSVIGGHDHDGLLERAALAQLAEEIFEALIELADLRIVEIDQMRAIVGVEVDLLAQEGEQLARGSVHRPVIGLAELLGKARLRAIIAVDVEVVKEQEEGTPVPGREPLQAPRAHAIGRAEGGGRAAALRPGRDGDVALEAAAQAETRPHEDPAHESRRGETPLVQRRRERRQIVRQRELFGHHAVLARIETGEQRGVGGKRPGGGRVGLLEENALGGEPVQERRSRARVAVGSQVIGAQRVERDQQEIPELRSFAAAGRDGRDREQQPDGSASRILERAKHGVAVLAARGSGRAA